MWDTYTMDRLAYIVALSSASADGIEAGIYEALHSVGLGREQIHNKLVFINLDGASVNQGKKGGVAKKNQGWHPPCRGVYLVYQSQIGVGSSGCHEVHRRWI